MVAAELWKVASAAGKSPSEALRDPDLAFNLSVMRAAGRARSLKLGLLVQQISGDSFGIGTIVETLRLLYEDA